LDKSSENKKIPVLCGSLMSETATLAIAP